MSEEGESIIPDPKRGELIWARRMAKADTRKAAAAVIEYDRAKAEETL